MRRLLLQALLLLIVCTASAQGVPFLKNFLAADYQANNQNYDIDVGADGTVFVANFEGLMYYDRAEWRILRTPGISRVTVTYCDNNGIVWVGGYNYFGRVERKANGELFLRRIGKPDVFRGEVVEIWKKNNKLYLLVSDGNIYKVEGEKVSLKNQINNDYLGFGMSVIVDTDSLDKSSDVVVMNDITQEEQLDNGLKALVKKGEGLIIANESGRHLYTITENDGLCSNDVNYVSYDGHGILWGATGKGVFALSVPSAFSRFSAKDGLIGEVMSIEYFDGKIYAGTTNGLFYQSGRSFVKVVGINHGCWQLVPSHQGLLAATANGVFVIAPGGVVRRLTNSATTSILNLGSYFYSGEMNGVYMQKADGSNRKKVSALETVTKILQDDEGVIWLQNIYGDVWRKKDSEKVFRPYHIKDYGDISSTIVQSGTKVLVIDAESKEPFPYPQFSYFDYNGVLWLTDNQGKSLYRWKKGKRLNDFRKLLYPINGMSIRSMYVNEKEIWLGNDNGLVVIAKNEQDVALQTKPVLRFRMVELRNDSILWGGYGDMPESLPELSSDERDLRFTYALDYAPLVGNTLYRYRLNNGNWSAWDNNHDADFINLPHGSYTLTIQARLATGELTDEVSMDFSIAYPFYMRWYMNLLYLLLVGLLVYAIFRYRLHRLNMEKQKLERIVKERTSEVVKQKDEIEEKSRSLEKALDDLNNAQHELIRQEKMATVGKLTQGLIDRILNPLNYINNFSKLSEGLVKDIEANIEDDKDNMDSENYEDTMDVLDMLRGNLQKVGEHGQNTTRTLKAMEEMLKDRSGGIVPMALVSVLRQDEDMLKNYYAEDIKKYGIKIIFNLPEQEIPINGNADQLSKMLMSLLGNAVYAVVKKASRGQAGAGQYVPEITLTTAVADQGKVSIAVHDNGIGIEDTIIDKVFDPFFTTKTTGEAAGVGLYLSREIVQNHGGDIQVKSVKNEYSEFTIVLPTTNA